MTGEARKGIIAFSITDRGALYSSYMQYVQNGGVFVPTARSYDIGDKVFVLLKLMDDTAPHPIEAEVVWITPPGAQGNKTPGVGLQFSASNNGAAKNSIEQHLGGGLQSGRPTQTM
jgi:type IV pilus assembly protein PilZ